MEVQDWGVEVQDWGDEVQVQQGEWSQATERFGCIQFPEVLSPLVLEENGRASSKMPPVSHPCTSSFPSTCVEVQSL